MIPERIVIVGASGYLGGYLSDRLSDRGHEVKALDRTHGFDVRQRPRIKELFSEFKPTVLIDCLDYGSLTQCQTNILDAEDVIVKGSGFLSGLCDMAGVYLIYASSSYVFDGTQPMRKECDETNPINAYGVMKLLAERHQNRDSLILRTSGLYGTKSAGRDNWDLWAMNRIRNGWKIEAFSNLWTTPTYIGDWFNVVEWAIKKRPAGKFHLAGPDRVSRLQFFERLVDQFAPSHKVVPVEAEDTLRPMDASIDSTRLTKESGIYFLSLDEGLLLADY